MRKRDDAELTTRYADMFSAMGTEPRLRIVRLLLRVPLRSSNKAALRSCRVDCKVEIG